MKSWIRPCVGALQHHGTPRDFRFTKNERGGEMVLRLLAGGEPKEWLPKEEPFVMMKDMPPGCPSLLRPENTKN